MDVRCPHCAQMVRGLESGKGYTHRECGGYFQTPGALGSGSAFQTIRMPGENAIDWVFEKLGKWF